MVQLPSWASSLYRPRPHQRCCGANQGEEVFRVVARREKGVDGREGAKVPAIGRDGVLVGSGL